MAAVRLTFEKSVYKIYRHVPKLKENGKCVKDKVNQFCGCYGNAIEKLDNYRIFDLTQDPFEDEPMSEKSERYNSCYLFSNDSFNHFILIFRYDILHKLAFEEFQKADQELNPPSQLSDKFSVMPRFWMQPCANFPACRTR